MKRNSCKSSSFNRDHRRLFIGYDYYAVVQFLDSLHLLRHYVCDICLAYGPGDKFRRGFPFWRGSCERVFSSAMCIERVDCCERACRKVGDKDVWFVNACINGCTFTAKRHCKDLKVEASGDSPDDTDGLKDCYTGFEFLQACQVEWDANTGLGQTKGCKPKLSNSGPGAKK